MIAQIPDELISHMPFGLVAPRQLEESIQELIEDHGDAAPFLTRVYDLLAFHREVLKADESDPFTFDEIRRHELAMRHVLAAMKALSPDVLNRLEAGAKYENHMIEQRRIDRMMAL